MNIHNLHQNKSIIQFTIISFREMPTCSVIHFRLPLIQYKIRSESPCYHICWLRYIRPVLFLRFTPRRAIIIWQQLVLCDVEGTYLDTGDAQKTVQREKFGKTKLFLRCMNAVDSKGYYSAKLRKCSVNLPCNLITCNSNHEIIKFAQLFLCQNLRVRCE